MPTKQISWLQIYKFIDFYSTGVDKPDAPTITFTNETLYSNKVNKKLRKIKVASCALKFYRHIVGLLIFAENDNVHKKIKFLKMEGTLTW